MWKKIIESKYLYLFVNIVVLIYSMSFITHLIVFLMNFSLSYNDTTYIIQLLTFYSHIIFTLGIMLELRMTTITHINMKNKSDILNSMVNKNIDVNNAKISIIGFVMMLLLYAIYTISLSYIVFVLYLIFGFLTAITINTLINNIYKQIK